MELIQSKLVTHLNILISNGYKHPPHYIGLLNHMWLYCNSHYGYAQHELMVKDTNNYRYVCEKCHCSVEYVG